MPNRELTDCDPFSIEVGLTSLGPQEECEIGPIQTGDQRGQMHVLDVEFAISPPIPGDATGEIAWIVTYSPDVPDAWAKVREFVSLPTTLPGGTASGTAVLEVWHPRAGYPTQSLVLTATLAVGGCPQNTSSAPYSYSFTEPTWAESSTAFTPEPPLPPNGLLSETTPIREVAGGDGSVTGNLATVYAVESGGLTEIRLANYDPSVPGPVADRALVADLPPLSDLDIDATTAGFVVTYNLAGTIGSLGGPLMVIIGRAWSFLPGDVIDWPDAIELNVGEAGLLDQTDFYLGSFAGNTELRAAFLGEIDGVKVGRFTRAVVNFGVAPASPTLGTPDTITYYAGELAGYDPDITAHSPYFPLYLPGPFVASREIRGGKNLLLISHVIGLVDTAIVDLDSEWELGFDSDLAPRRDANIPSLDYGWRLVYQGRKDDGSTTIRYAVAHDNQPSTSWQIYTLAESIGAAGEAQFSTPTQSWLTCHPYIAYTVSDGTSSWLSLWMARYPGEDFGPVFVERTDLETIQVGDQFGLRPQVLFMLDANGMPPEENETIAVASTAIVNGKVIFRTLMRDGGGF